MSDYRFCAILLAIASIISLHTQLVSGINCRKKPPMMNPFNCCKIPELIDMEIKDKCKAYVSMPTSNRSMTKAPMGRAMNASTATSAHSHQAHNFLHSCSHSCFFNESGILDLSHSKLQEDQLTAYLKGVLANHTDLVPIVQSSFRKCMSNIDEMMAKFQRKMQSKLDAPAREPQAAAVMSQERNLEHPLCPPFAGFIMGCVFKETFANCPPSIWTNSAECTEMRQYNKDCMKTTDGANDFLPGQGE